MICRTLNMMFLSVLLVGCTANLSSVDTASGNYKENKDYTSLKIIYNNIYKGMNRKEVEDLLGAPDYSPVNGQYYYSSDQLSYIEEQEREVAIGLVIDYRDKNDVITEKLQNYWLGPIGE